MKNFFMIVANLLMKIAQKLNLTYNEVNVLIWYLLIPLSWCVMIDFIIKMPLFTPLFVLCWTFLFIKYWKNFREWCDQVFQKSVDFLLWFQHIGWNYEKASVIICCLIPVPIYLILIAMLILQ